MIRSLFTRRRGVAVAAATIGVASLSLAFAGTAGAVPSSTQLVASGSQTSYATMTGLTDLFNNVAGCDLTASTSDPAHLNCGTSPITAGTPGGEQGFDVAADNPYNDYSVQAPAIGSGNGATALAGRGSGTPTQPIAYARVVGAQGWYPAERRRVRHGRRLLDDVPDRSVARRRHRPRSPPSR